MASASSFLSEDQFLCSVCLDVFTEPVSIPCGHNFCKSCISRHWEGKEQCQCPLCNEKFNKGLKLCVNTAFREVVEDFKKHRQETSRDATHLLVQPGQVPCDCCLGNKFRASKTCLVCLASYCEIHLEPHQRVEALKRHTLTDPVQNLEDKICKKHNRILEHFCKNDLTCICDMCTDHSDHDTVPLEKAFVNKKGHVGKKKAEIKSKKSGKKAQKSKLGVQHQREEEAIPNNVVSNQIQAPHIWLFPNKSPHNFNRCSGVPGNRDFPIGRFCYEIQAKSRYGWHLDVVTESVFGKSTFTQIHQNGPCFIRLENNNNCRALQHDPVQLFLIKTPEKVLVFVDYESEIVSFYDPRTDIVIYSLTGCRFIERILLCLIPFTTVNDTTRLQKKVPKVKAWSQLSQDSFYFILLVCFILFFIISILPK